MTDKALEVMDVKKTDTCIPPRLVKGVFDSLDHSRLLAKLKTLGVGCTALEWFGSYLSGRQQYDRCWGLKSGCYFSWCTKGFHPRSGPIHHLHERPSQHPEIWFSGNIIRLWQFKTLFVIFCQRYLQCGPCSKLNMIIYWRLLLGAAILFFWSTQTRPSWWCWKPDKCCRDYLQTFTSLDLLGKEVTTTFSVQHLGLQVDSTLSFDERITYTVSSCLCSLGQINRVRQPSQHQDIGECYQ